MSLNDFVKTYIHNLSVFYCTDINENDEELNNIVDLLEQRIKELIENVQ